MDIYTVNANPVSGSQMKKDSTAWQGRQNSDDMAGLHSSAERLKVGHRKPRVSAGRGWLDRVVRLFVA
jgi:hypothetical protein